MRIVLMSDLHIEFEHPHGPRRPSRAWLELNRCRHATPGHPRTGPWLGKLRGQMIDLVVLAGDIGVGVHGIAYADAVARFLGAPAVYVAGNHEFYGNDLLHLLPALRLAAAMTKDRVTFLENDVMTLPTAGGPVHVLGCTMWTDYALHCQQIVAATMTKALVEMNDHAKITVDGHRFTPADALARHQISRAWLAEALARIRADNGDEARIIIVTHHAPAPECVPLHYRDHLVSAAYASDVRADIAAWRPIAWMHGHLHDSVDLQIGGTRIVSAPRGYVGYEAAADTFQPRFFEF